MFESQDVINHVPESTPFRIILSGAKKSQTDSTPWTKSIIMCVADSIQREYTTANQHFTHSFSFDELRSVLNECLLHGFTQAHIQSPQNDVYLRWVKPLEIRIKTTTPSFSWSRNTSSLENYSISQKTKQYPITFENSKDVLCALGIANDAGVLPSKQAKYKQINHFIELLDTLDVMKQDTISIIDCGCGKAYLSLSLAYYLTKTKNISVTLVGIDSNQTLIDFCNTTAQKLQLTTCTFVCTKISDYNKNPSDNVDILLALHACDTATDDAIFLGIRSHAKAIIAAPCCHKFVNSQLQKENAPEEMKPLLLDGITKERIADMMTDTLRRDILRSFDYKAELIEFTAPEHTLKNIMIRAEITRSTTPATKYKTIVENTMKNWGVEPKLWHLLQDSI